MGKQSDIAGLLLHAGINCLIAVTTGGAAGTTATASAVYELAKGLTSGLATNHLASLISFKSLEERLTSKNPNNVNHDLERLFRQSAVIAVEYIRELFLAELREDDDLFLALDGKERKAFFKGVKIFFDENIDDIRHKMKNEERASLDRKLVVNPEPFFDEITNYMLNVSYASLDIDTKDRIREFYRTKLPFCFQLAFKESLKSDDRGFKAYQLWIFDELQKQNLLIVEKQEEVLTAIKQLEDGKNIITEAKLDTLLLKYSDEIYGKLQSGFLSNIKDRFEILSKYITAHFDELYKIINEHYNLSLETKKIVDQIWESIKSEREKSFDKILTSPPFHTQLFVGRTDELAKIKESFNGNEPLLISGEGGIGKTTLASQYWIGNQNNYNHFVWLFADSGIRNALLSLSSALKIDKKLGSKLAQVDPDEHMELVLQGLANLPGPCLLVVDNANNENDLTNYERELCSLSNFHVLVTTRINSDSLGNFLKVKSLSGKEATELFEKYYHKKLDIIEKELLNKIFSAINSNTLVIELLSKGLRQKNKFKDIYTLGNVLSDLREKGLLLLDAPDVNLRYQKFKSAKPNEVIRAMYDINTLGSEEIKILNNFAVLPALNISYEFLTSLIRPIDKQLFEEALNRLFMNGWIDFDENQKNFKISQVVQQVVLEASRDKLRADCEFLIQSVTNILFNADFGTKGPFIISIEVVRNIGIVDKETAYLAYLLASEHYTYENYHEAESVLNTVLQFINSTKAEELDNIKLNSLILWTDILQVFDKNAEAEPVFYTIKQLSEKLQIPFEDYEYANYLSKVGRFAEAEPILYRFFNKQNNITSQEQRTKERGLNVALSAHDMAVHCRRQGRYDEALKFHRLAVNLYRELMGPDHRYVTVVEMSYSETLIEEERDLNLAEAILATIHNRMKTVEFTNYQYSLFMMLVARLMIAKKDLTQAIEAIEMGSDGIAKTRGETSKIVLEMLIKKNLLAFELYQIRKITDELWKKFISELLPFFYENISLFINRFGRKNPFIIKSLKLISNIYIELGDIDKAKEITMKYDEFIRIVNQYGEIRVSNFQEQEISKQRQIELAETFSRAQHIPVDVDLLHMQEFILPFYKTFRLYQITFLNTIQRVKRYILYNGEEFGVVTYNNKIIYSIGLIDGNFAADNVTDYASFLHDSVCGRHGFFYTMRNSSDFLWRADLETTNEEKQTIEKFFPNKTVVKSTDDYFEFDVFQIFMDSIFWSQMRVLRSAEKLGVVTLENSLIGYVGNDGRVLFGDEEKGNLINVSGETVLLDEADKTLFKEQLPVSNDLMFDLSDSK